LRDSAEASEPGEVSWAGSEEAVVVWMPGPGSFTGEDVVELHVHAGARNVQQVVRWLIDAGARAAGAGDFSRRAFEHGRLTLDQAEGIAAVIGAQTQAELEHGRRLMSGELTREVTQVRDRLAALRAMVEGAIGFPDDLEDDEVLEWRAQCGAIEADVRGWLARFAQGMRARSRLRVVLAGPPNAGKSALFNALVGASRAIVADVPGTTRDYVEVECEWSGKSLTLVDTAGFRGARDVIEAAGVERSAEQVEGADLVLWIRGADQEAPPLPDSLHQRAPTDVLGVVAKADLFEDGTRETEEVQADAVVSAHSGLGVEALQTEIVARLWGDADSGWIGLQRHEARCREAVSSLEDAARELDKGTGALELAALPLQEAQGRLDAILGRSASGPVGAQVLHDIFRSFCIGK
ncbi:MAG: tRNA modification GTPase, partial [Nannocystaceae bacterium]